MRVPGGLYAIVDLPHAGALSPEEAVGAVLAGGCRCVQLRAKHASTRERIEIARRVGSACDAVGARLWINDDLEVALAPAPGIRGLHVGQDDLARLPAGWRMRLRAQGRGLGVSTHDRGQVERAVELAPDYLGFGPVYATTGKTNPDPVVGIAGLADACTRSSVPVVAIGGIDLERARACLEAGAIGVAVIGALVSDHAAGVTGNTRAFVRVGTAALATREPGAMGAND